MSDILGPGVDRALGILQRRRQEFHTVSCLSSRRVTDTLDAGPVLFWWPLTSPHSPFLSRCCEKCFPSEEALCASFGVNG